MIEVEDELVYAAISSNRNANNISRLDQYLLYSRCRSPIIYDLESKSVAAILAGHAAEVNGQCFVDTRHDASSDDTIIHVISTAHDRKAILWTVSKNEQLPLSHSHQILHQIESPDDSVFMTRSSLRAKEDEFVTILTSMNGNIYLYKNDDLLQTIKTKDCYFDSKIHQIIYRDGGDQERTFTCFALAGSDNKVHLFHLTDDCNLVHLVDLSGFNDWIKCLAFYTLPDRDNEFLLAAACQDSLIQVWHLTFSSLTLNEAARVRTRVSKPIWGDVPVKLTSTLETVLSGHVGFVHGLCWFSPTQGSETLQLASCSSDRRIIIWRSAIAKREGRSSMADQYEWYPASEGVWQEVRRLGETGEDNLPFLGVCLSKDQSTLYGQSLRGAIHSWSLSKDPRRADWWTPSATITGHFDSVTDLAWERTGAYLLSSSNDKTCRLHAIAASDGKWHELARPQVHGYEINCLASLNFLKFASGAEEKTIRTFEVTKFFIKNFKALAERPLPEYCREHLDSFDELPAHAQLPALGLSNRGSQWPFDVNEQGGQERTTNRVPALSAPQQSGDDGEQTKDAEAPALSDNHLWQEESDLVHKLSAADHLDAPPHEEVLLMSTLWWEKNKLFGHGNELHALACDSTGTFLASASKANRADLASVIVWETEKFRKVATIEHHTLTVTRLRFSPDDKYLLSVSRDRTWCLCERDPSGQLRNAYRKLVGTVKANAIHERIIWDCCWTHDSSHFLTVSRDKKAILWSIDKLRSQLAGDELSMTADGGVPTMNLNYVTSSTFKSSIQAVDSTRNQVTVNKQSVGANTPQYLFVLGFEDGSVSLYNVTNLTTTNASPDHQWQLLATMANLHQLPIRRLAIRPRAGPEDKESGCVGSHKLLLASGGDDSMVRLTRLLIKTH